MFTNREIGLLKISVVSTMQDLNETADDLQFFDGEAKDNVGFAQKEFSELLTKIEGLI